VQGGVLAGVGGEGPVGGDVWLVTIRDGVLRDGLAGDRCWQLYGLAIDHGELMDMKEQFELAGVGLGVGLGWPSERAGMRRSVVLKVGEGAGRRLSCGRRSARGWEATVVRMKVDCLFSDAFQGIVRTVLLYVPIGEMVSVRADVDHEI
jgi:hypothetical protein